MEKLLAAKPYRKQALQTSELLELFGSAANDSRFRWNLRRGCQGTGAVDIANFTAIPGNVEATRDGRVEEARQSIHARLGWAGLRFLESPVYRVAFLTDDLASFRRQMDHLYASLNLPYRQAHEYLSDSFIKDPLAKAVHPWQPPGAPGLIASLALPHDVALYLQQVTEADTLHRLMRIAFAITRYRAKYDKQPSNLEELVPEFLTHVPLDPFDNKPLRMKKVSAGSIIYSVGPNMEDNDGQEGTTEHDDIVFRVP
jgi:hypothetical protein